MSGGSFDYLCHSWDLSDLFGKRRALEEMSVRLAGLDEQEFPGAKAAAVATERLRVQLQVMETHVETHIELLRATWQAVEWWDSCDWGPDDVRKALTALVAPKEARP